MFVERFLKIFAIIILIIIILFIVMYFVGKNLEEDQSEDYILNTNTDAEQVIP